MLKTLLKSTVTQAERLRAQAAQLPSNCIVSTLFVVKRSVGKDLGPQVDSRLEWNIRDVRTVQPQFQRAFTHANHRRREPELERCSVDDLCDRNAKEEIARRAPSVQRRNSAGTHRGEVKAFVKSGRSRRTRVEPAGTWLIGGVELNSSQRSE
jgi:hypothetical protein